jgi:DNA-binding NtrC family response regulator
MAVDCARLPASLIARLIFRDSAWLDPAGRGTIYLRTPALLARDVQAQLVQWLEERAEAGPRFVVGCQEDPETDVRAGRLHENLLAMIGALKINLLPLRQRLADLPALVESMLTRINCNLERPVEGLTAEALDLFRAYSWPENLRQLYRVLQSSAARARSDKIDVDDLPLPVRLAGRMREDSTAPPEKKLVLDDILAEAERRLILAALRKAGGNRTRAAELLSVWRPRLLRRMEALGIQFE